MPTIIAGLSTFRFCHTTKRSGRSATRRAGDTTLAASPGAITTNERSQWWTVRLRGFVGLLSEDSDVGIGSN